MFIADNSIFKSIMQFFSARSIALKECYLMMNFEKKSFYRFKNIRKNANLMVKPLIKCDFVQGRLPKVIFQKICFSGGKQIAIHKVLAAFIVKNFHLRTSLSSQC